MKKGILFLMVSAFLFTACSKRTCPAYGASDTVTTSIENHC